MNTIQIFNFISEKTKGVYFLLVVFIIGLNSCLSDLMIENENELDTQALQGDSLRLFAEQSYISYWQAINKPTLQLSAIVAADQFTASWGNFAWQKISNEPRQAWDNSEFADDDKVSENLWYDLYSALYQANKSLELFNKGVEASNDSLKQYMLKALCYHVQGLCLGQLGLVYDQAYIINENNIDENSALKPYTEVVDSAFASLQKCIDICSKYKFTMPSNIINGLTVSNVYLKELSYSYMARFMVLKARNADENSKTNWAKVADYSNKGILSDFGPMGNGLPSAGGFWYNLNYYYLVLQGYARVDNRILNLMDNRYPANYPLNEESGEAIPNDKRLSTDFQYLPSVDFLPERGRYHFSNYRYKRFDSTIYKAIDKLVEYRAYECDLYYAEALLRINAANVGNVVNFLIGKSSERTVRGGLTPLPTNSKVDDVLNAIFYEREIELLAQGFFVGFCDMRRRDLLQKGTPLHFPVPAKELQAQNKTIYTFGGVENADGVNTSIGGWK